MRESDFQYYPRIFFITALALKFMLSFKEANFYNPTVGRLTFQMTVQEILRYMAEKPEKFYDVVVGCDSSSEEIPTFPVVIVVLRVGEGGRFFIRKISYPSAPRGKFHNFHQRILQEILLSCELALSLKEELSKQIRIRHASFHYRFRYIHADIGEQGPTKDMIKEVVNLIQSNGFEAKIKPESFAASIVADRFT